MLRDDVLAITSDSGVFISTEFERKGFFRISGRGNGEAGPFIRIL